MSSVAEEREMLQVVAEHNIHVSTNPVHGLQAIPQLLELAQSGKMKGKGIVVVDPEQMEREREGGAKV